MELHGDVKAIWENEIKSDYDQCLFWEESVLQSAFYYHLRNRISRKSKNEFKNVVLYPELRVRFQGLRSKEEDLRIDIAVLELKECDIKKSEDCDRRWAEEGSCIKGLIALFEFKHLEFPMSFKTVVERLRKFEREGIYYLYDKSQTLLKAESFYLGVVLDKKIPNLPKREEIIGDPDSFKNLHLLIGGNVGERSEFKCL